MIQWQWYIRIYARGGTLAADVESDGMKSWPSQIANGFIYASRVSLSNLSQQ